MVGAFIIITTLTISGAIISRAHGREILAFHAQQVMPLAQEGIENMTPTMAKTAGTMAKEVAKGLKEGFKEDSNK